MPEERKLGGKWIRIGEEMLEDLKKRRDTLEVGIARLEKSLAEDRVRYDKINRRQE